MTHDHEKYNRLKWMTDDQWACAQLLSDLFGGFHHVYVGRVKELGTGISYNTTASFSTFDSNKLTRLVLLSHQQCIRASIIPSGFGYIKISLFKRHLREGQMHERHPDLNGLIEMCNTLINREWGK